MQARPNPVAATSANRKAILKHLRAMQRIAVDVQSIDAKFEHLQQQLAITLVNLIKSQGFAADEIAFAPQKARIARRLRTKRTIGKPTRKT